MLIELTSDEIYRGKKYAKGSTIEVGTALGERLILNGHKKSSSTASKDKYLSDIEIDSLDYKAASALIKEYAIETDDKNFLTYKAALKAYFADKRA